MAEGGEEGAAAPEGATFELEHAIGYSGHVASSLVAHPNGQDLIYAAGGCIVSCDKDDPHKQTFFRGHDDDITCLAVSRSGRYIASGQAGANADVIVWDFEEKAVLFRCEEHDGGIASVAFTEDEKLLATLGVGDKSLVVWEVASGNIVASTGVGDTPMTAVAWGGNAKDIKRRHTTDYILATAGKSGTAILWLLNPYTSTLTGTKFNTGARPCIRDYTCAQFSADGDWLFCGSSTGDFTTFNIRSCGLKALTPCCGGGVLSISVSGNDSILVGGGDGSMTEYSTRDEEKEAWVDMWKGQFNGAVSSVSRAADGSVYVGTAWGHICRAFVRTELPGEVWSEAHFGGIVGVSFHKGISDAFATVSKDNTVRVWDLNDYHVTWWAKVDLVPGVVPTCIVWAIGCIYTGWSDGVIRCHDVHTESGKKDLLWQIDGAHVSGVTAIEMSDSEKFFVTGGEDGEVRLWDVKSRELVSHLKEHNSRVTSLALFSDHVHALSSSRDRSIFVWDLRAEKHVSTNTQRMGGIHAITLHPNMRNVISVGQEKKVTFWELNKPDPVRLISPAHDGEAMCVAVSNNGQLVATGGTDDMVMLWDMAGGSLLAEGSGHSGVVQSLAFSPDDKQLVSVGEDGNAMIWNVYGPE